MGVKYLQNLKQINKSSGFVTYRAENVQTVQTMLQQLNLETRYFVVLVNGKKVSLTHTINKDDSIVVLPKIAGG